MLCEECGVDRPVEVRADQVVCTVCASVLRSAQGAGALVNRTFTRERHGRAPLTAVRRAVKAASIASEAERAAAERAAQSAVEAVCAAGRREPGAARAVADRAVRSVISRRGEVALPEGAAAVEACLERAEAHLLQSGARAAGKSAAASELLQRARARAACITSAAVTEDIWALAAVAVVSADERPSSKDEQILREAALAMAKRFRLLPKRICSAAILDIWMYAF